MPSCVCSCSRPGPRAVTLEPAVSAGGHTSPRQEPAPTPEAPPAPSPPEPHLWMMKFRCR